MFITQSWSSVVKKQTIFVINSKLNQTGCGEVSNIQTREHKNLCRCLALLELISFIILKQHKRFHTCRKFDGAFEGTVSVNSAVKRLARDLR